MSPRRTTHSLSNKSALARRKVGSPRGPGYHAAWNELEESDSSRDELEFYENAGRDRTVDSLDGWHDRLVQRSIRR